MQSSHSCLSSAVQLHCTGQLLYRSQGQFCPAPSADITQEGDL
uniref:Uncharacterized protein n=1 Tax=Anguilla anguilla TaxID=7936 RepID=A0A0E9RDM4_ANGAN